MTAQAVTGGENFLQLGSRELFSHPPRTSTMASSQQFKGRDVVLSTLDGSVQVLNLAKDTCGIPPAQIVFGSASVLLTMIRASFLFTELGRPLTHIHLGHDGQQPRLRRPWARLRRCMSGSLPETEGKTIGSTQPVRPRCDRRVNVVSQTGDARSERFYSQTLSVAELSQRSRGRSPSKANEMRSTDSPSPKPIRKKLLLGSRIFSGFSTFSTCVQSVL